MKLWLLILPFLFLATPVLAQDQAKVVASCGSVTLQAGTQSFRTIDTNGVTCAGGSVAAPTSVWSAADAAVNAMTLSNGGLTVSNATELAGSHSIRGTISKTSGRVYVEFLVNPISGGYGVWGLGSSSFDPTTLLGNVSLYSAGIYSANQNFTTTGFTSNYTITVSPGSNDVFALAVDFAAGKVWIAQNNVWAGGSSPSAGTLPILSFTPATVGALFPSISMNNSISFATWTLQSTAAALKYAPPSGFTAWDAP